MLRISIMAQDMIRDVDRKSTRGNVCFKLDMAKSYDRLERRSTGISAIFLIPSLSMGNPLGE